MNILEKIAAEKRREVEALRPRAAELKRLAVQRSDRRDFAAALRPEGAASPPRLALIAEVKKASPSAGIIRADFDPVVIAIEYEKAGASAISVLTDEKFFQGHIGFLEKIREKVSLPLLRKDFIIDALQIFEAAAYGADAVLLIAAILDDNQLREFRIVAENLGLSALVEVHDETELERATNSGASIIGINNRNLKTFEVDLKTTERLAALVGRVTSRGESVFLPNHAASVTRPTIVAESGIHTRADAERVRKAGVNAILVGESLMRSGNIAAKVKDLLDVGRVTSRGESAKPPRRLRRLQQVWAGEGNSRYFLTICVDERKRVLANDAIHERLRTFLYGSAERYGWYPSRYVIMPDHLHLLATHKLDSVSVGEWVKALKAFVGKKEFRWQKSFFDHVLRSEESEAEKWKYIVQNPVRAGLVKEPEEWPYAGEIEM